MVYVALLVGPAALLLLLAWTVYRQQPQARLFALAIFFALGFWYLLPGTLFLLGGDVSIADADLLLAHSDVETAIILVHASLALLLTLPGIFSAIPRRLRAAVAGPIETRTDARLDVLLLATITSSVAFLIVRYADLGPAFALQLLVGLTSAREVMSFENFSTGASQSLLALWEIVTIFLSTFLAAVLVWQRKTLTVRFVGASIAVLLSFISSGSRTVLLLLIFAVAMALLGRTAARPQRLWLQYRRRRGSVQALLPLLLMAGLVTVAISVMLARFEGDATQSESLALNTVGAHNDMFRELVYVLKHGSAYRSDPWLFLQTPLTYAMPTFLGFDKSIPPHLIDFNLDRASIDLVNGEGNVFPGLIGDMVLCFGLFAPLVLWAMSAVILACVLLAASAGPSRTINSALLVALLCYYVVSFRNMQGAFAILIVLGTALSLALPFRPPKRDRNSNVARSAATLLAHDSNGVVPRQATRGTT